MNPQKKKKLLHKNRNNGQLLPEKKTVYMVCACSYKRFRK